MTASASSPVSSPPPPTASVSKSSTAFPVVHPVPEPTAQACFSSVSSSLYTAEHKEKIQKDTCTPSSYDDSEKTQQKPSFIVDSSTCTNTTSAPLSLPCCDESRDISSAIPDTNCENGHRGSYSLSASLVQEDKCERMCESSLNNHEMEQKKVHRTSDASKLNEHEHMKVTVFI